MREFPIVYALRGSGASIAQREEHLVVKRTTFRGLMRPLINSAM